VAVTTNQQDTVQLDFFGACLFEVLRLRNLLDDDAKDDIVQMIEELYPDDLELVCQIFGWPYISDEEAKCLVYTKIPPSLRRIK
jgi:hypothetical protein